MTSLRRILVPVDFSTSSRAALRYAVALAERFDARVDVLHVWSPLPELSWEPLAPSVFLSPHANELHRAEETHALHELVEEAQRTTLAPVTGRCETGDPRRVIVELAGGEPYDLVVLGVAGRSGITQRLLGGLTEKLLRRARVPILTVRGEGASS
jgi:nucleotide-binding universal stress UspA family protein